MDYAFTSKEWAWLFYFILLIWKTCKMYPVCCGWIFIFWELSKICWSEKLCILICSMFFSWISCKIAYVRKLNACTDKERMHVKTTGLGVIPIFMDSLLTKKFDWSDFQSIIWYDYQHKWCLFSGKCLCFRKCTYRIRMHEMEFVRQRNVFEMTYSAILASNYPHIMNNIGKCVNTRRIRVWKECVVRAESSLYLCNLKYSLYAYMMCVCACVRVFVWKKNTNIIAMHWESFVHWKFDGGCFQNQFMLNAIITVWINVWHHPNHTSEYDGKLEKLRIW